MAWGKGVTGECDGAAGLKEHAGRRETHTLAERQSEAEQPPDLVPRDLGPSADPATLAPCNVGASLNLPASLSSSA